MVRRLSAIALVFSLLASAEAARANPPVIGAYVDSRAYVQEPSPVGGGLIGAMFGPLTGPGYNAPPPVVVEPHVAAYATEDVARAVDPIYTRTEVAYDGPATQGSIVIDTPNKFL